MGAVGRLRALFVTGALVATGLVAVTPSTAGADGPGSGSPWIVAIGDSAISGEAGRWAGNTNNGSGLIDATGADTYYDNAGRTALTSLLLATDAEIAEAPVFGCPLSSSIPPPSEGPELCPTN